MSEFNPCPGGEQFPAPSGSLVAVNLGGREAVRQAISGVRQRMQELEDANQQLRDILAGIVSYYMQKDMDECPACHCPAHNGLRFYHLEQSVQHCGCLNSKHTSNK